MLNDRKEHYLATGKTLKPTPARYKSDFPFLKEVDSLALANAQLHLEASFAKFFRKEGGYPKFKSKKTTKRSYTTNCVNNSIRLEGNKIKLPKAGWVSLELHRQLPEDSIIKSVTVSQTPAGDYYITVLVEYDNIVIPVSKDNLNVLGMDYSSAELYVDSEGNKPAYPKYYRKAEKQLARAQRSLSRKQKGSQNRNKQRLKVAKLHEKVSNQRRDFLHKQSRQIANAVDVVCVEDIDMKSMSKGLKLGKSTADNGFGLFRQMLKYKLEDQGKYFVVINKWYASSQTCNICNVVNPAIKDLKIRSWVCENCGTLHDRDHNAAINIKNEGLRQLLAA
jgi:putative transposase